MLRRGSSSWSSLVHTAPLFIRLLWDSFLRRERGIDNADFVAPRAALVLHPPVIAPGDAKPHTLLHLRPPSSELAVVGGAVLGKMGLSGNGSVSGEDAGTAVSGFFFFAEAEAEDEGCLCLVEGMESGRRDRRECLRHLGLGSFSPKASTPSHSQSSGGGGMDSAVFSVAAISTAVGVM